MIGGTDIAFWVRDGHEAADLILRTAQRYWPKFVIENIDDPQPFAPRQGIDLPEPSGNEFFIYRDERVALDWEAHGATLENSNSRLYVILGNRVQPNSGFKSLTVVCGELVGETRRMLDEIRAGLADLNTLMQCLSDQEAA
jgi:hypothetical protein